MWSRLSAAASGRSQAVAISREGLQWTFAELIQHAAAVARCLRGFERPPRVGVALPGGPEFTAMQFACLQLGALFVPLPEQARRREVEHYLRLTRPDLLVTDTVADTYRAAGATRVVDFAAVCSAAIDDSGSVSQRPDELGAARVLQCTAGSTGQPKGVLLQQANLLANLRQCTGLPQTLADQPVFCPLPQFHATGGALALESLCHGVPVHFANRFDPAADLRRMAESACRTLVASPSYLRLLLRLGVLHAGELVDLRDLIIGTAAVDSDLVEQLQQAFPALRIHLRYGLSEAVGPLTNRSLAPGELLVGPGDVGAALPGVELQLRSGELWARADSVASHAITERGVVRMVDAGGFLPTGDLAELDDAGVQLRGRRSSFLKVLGLRVDPSEVEAVLREVPGVVEVVVFGIDDPVQGQRVVACLETDEPGPGDAELAAACQRGLSAHKQPGRIERFAGLPRTPAGKPDRVAIMAGLLLRL